MAFDDPDRSFARRMPDDPGDDPFGDFARDRFTRDDIKMAVIWVAGIAAFVIGFIVGSLLIDHGWTL